MKIGKFNLEMLSRDADQLWAEAAHYEAEGESIVLQEDLWSVAAEVRAEREFENPYLAPLRAHFGDKSWMRATTVWQFLEIKPENQAKASTHVGKALRNRVEHSK